MSTFNSTMPSLADIEYARAIERDTDFSILAQKFTSEKEFEVPYVEYFNSSDYKVSEYFICYFDIMGYKSLLSKYNENYFLEVIKATIDAVYCQIDNIFLSASLFGSWCVESKLDFGFKIFSDNVILFLSVTEDEMDNMGRLSALIRGVYTLQRNLMGQYNILIRGAITTGELFHCNEFIYGSGLIKAVTMEEKVAKYPRIIIDSQCIQMLKDTKNIMHNFDTLHKYLVSDFNKSIFIGYLNAESVSIIFMTYLKRHQYLIEENLRHNLPNGILEKYKWCAEYHNFICSIYELESFIINVKNG